MGAQHCPLGLHALWGLHAAGMVGGRPRGGWPATVVRGAWCQALSLPRPPVLWSGQPGFRDPCVPGAVRAGVGTEHRPHSVRLCGPALLAVGVAEGRPRGVPSTIVRGIWGQALSLPRLPAHWAGCWGPPPTCCGCGCVGVGAQHCPFGLHALWGLRAAGVVGGRPRGGVACYHCEGRLVSGAVPPPAARPLERAARVPRPVCPGCGRCGRGDPTPAPRRAPLRVGVARPGGGGRASLGGLPSAVVRGVRGQTLPLPRLPALWAGCQGSLGVCDVCGLCAVRVVVRGAALLLSLWCSPLRCLVAVLCSPCACRAPFPARAPCSAAGYPLFLSWLRCSLPFPLPFSLACTFSLPPLWCVSQSFSLPARRSLSLGPLLWTCEQKGCNRACGGGGFVAPWHLVSAILGRSLTLAVVWYVTYLCFVRVLLSPISYRVVLVTASFIVRRFA